MDDILKSAWGDLLNENEKLAALLDEKAARIERLKALVRDAYNEGFKQGMREVQTSRGGLAFVDSKARAALAGEEGT